MKKTVLEAGLLVRFLFRSEDDLEKKCRYCESRNQSYRMLSKKKHEDGWLTVLMIVQYNNVPLFSDSLVITEKEEGHENY